MPPSTTKPQPIVSDTTSLETNSVQTDNIKILSPNSLNTPENLQKSEKKKNRLPDNIKLALVIFLLTSALILALFPHLGNQSNNYPSFSIFLLCGLSIIALTALLFSVIGKLGLGFGKTTLVLAFGYNATIAAIKFIIAPQALYIANQKSSFQIGFLSTDPNSIYFYLFSGIGILLLYIIAFRLIYGHFKKRNRDKTIHTKEVKKEKHFLRKTLAFVGILVVIVLIFIAGPLIIFGGSLTYLSYIFGSVGIPLVIALILGIFLAFKSFESVEKQMKISGNTTLLASFFWVGLSLIVLYHIMWVIFMLTLVHIWPFNTYSPK
jgi:MFS family permease